MIFNKANFTLHYRSQLSSYQNDANSQGAVIVTPNPFKQIMLLNWIFFHTYQYERPHHSMSHRLRLTLFFFFFDIT